MALDLNLRHDTLILQRKVNEQESLQGNPEPDGAAPYPPPPRPNPGLPPAPWRAKTAISVLY